MMKRTGCKRRSPVALASALLCAAGAASAAEPIEFGDGYTLDWRLSTTYTLSQRMKNPDPKLAAATGSNDGDNNFKKGALTANRASALFEGKISKGVSGFVLSGSTFYDDVYHRTNDNNPAANNPNGVNHPPPFNEFTEEARRYHGGYSRILDAYGYTTFDLGESRTATVRLGRHVVNWGEATFFPNIALAQGPFDGTKTGIPGTETKDAVLPEDQVSASIVMTPRWTLLGQAQLGFHPTLAPAPGSFLNSSDAIGPGGSCLGPYSTIPTIPRLFGGFSGCSFGVRGPDIEPKKTGQWGVGTRYRVSDETEAGLYYLNYSDRTPIPEINAFTRGVAIPAALQPAFGGISQIGNGSYNVRYFDDIKLLGTTVSTVLGNVAVSGELTYRQGAPVLVDTVVNPATGATIPNPTRANIVQANLGAFANVGRTPLADSLTLLGEISAISIGKVESRKAPGVEALGAAAAFFPSTDQLSFQSKTAVAMSVTAVLGYPGIFEGWDLNVPISYSRQLKGRTLVGGVGGEGDARYSVGATFTKGGNFSIGLTYLGFLGKASTDLLTNRLLTDRDQLSLVMKYTF
ncbi:MAG: PduX [Variovorax sp.]|nr:PduX [Variovorax sp.]